MKCQYCDRGCLIVPMSDLVIVRWKCNSCDTLYKYLTDESLVSIEWRFLHIKKRMYFVKIYSGVTGNAPEFVVRATFMDDWGEVCWTEVIRWNFIPDWTPHNAEANLAKVLLFL